MTPALGCHLWSFPRCTVAEAAQIVRALGLQFIDLGNGRDLDPQRVAADPEGEATRIGAALRGAELRTLDFFPQPAPGFVSNHPEVEVRARHREVYEPCLRFAARLGMSGITVSPGRFWPGEPPADGFARSAEELRWLGARAAQHGLQLRIEPHIESVTWTPELTLRMLAQVPGLSLTLDYSHFIFHGIPVEQIQALDPYATHWHARQARPGAAQCRTADGAIAFRRIVADLIGAGYNGGISLEYVHGAWMRQDEVDCLSETVALRDELRQYLAGDR